MRFPLTLTFKIALAPQIAVTDADGNLQLYLKQKLMKLRDAMNIFGDEAQTRLLYTVQADRIVDIGARFTVRDAARVEIGHVQGMGMRSLWRVHFQVQRADGAVLYDIREDNAWVKVADAILGDVPILGLFTGYLFNPKYNVTRPDGTRVMRLHKEPSLIGRRFKIDSEAALTPEEEGLGVLSLLLTTVMVHHRG